MKDRPSNLLKNKRRAAHNSTSYVKQPKVSALLSPIRNILNTVVSKKLDLSIQQDYSKKNDSENSSLRPDTILLVILCFFLPHIVASSC